MKAVRGKQLKLALVDVCQDGGRELNLGSSSRTQTSDRKRTRGSGEAAARVAAIDAGGMGRVEFLISESKYFLIEAMSAHDDRLSRFAHAVLRMMVEDH